MVRRDGEKVRHFNKAFHSSGMDEKLRDLYQQIMQFEFDDGSVDLSFAQRLAFENAWSIAFSERVIHEYKRFIFLVASAGHPVTPSDQVDQAWHLHLTYTRSYWERLCRDIIGRPLHHTPTRGGSAELHKFDIWYRRTLASYHAIFAEPPPSDIWPEPAIRFGDDLYFKRVNTRRYWMIPKPRIVPRRLGIRLFSRAGILTTLGSAAPLVAASSHNDSSQSNGFPRWLPLLLVSILIVGVGILFERRCVVCKRLNALKKTGAVEIRENDKKWEEYHCKHCASRVWREVNSGGGGGCGGCGGCGG